MAPLRAAALLALVQAAAAFAPAPASLLRAPRARVRVTAERKPEFVANTPDVVDNVDEVVGRDNALHDMVFAERVEPPQKTTFGLVLPGKEDPPMHLARVVSHGTDGLRSPRTQRIHHSEGFVEGDQVIMRLPWGIGPKDEEYMDADLGKRHFSWMRGVDICAVVR